MRTALRFAPLLLASCSGLNTGITQPVDHLLIVSVDGLRSDALIGTGPERLPAFHRLMQGAHTLNARTDPSVALTLPNHVGMLTGLPQQGDGGHGWTFNGSDLPDDALLHTTAGRYVPGLFDWAHDRGVRTALFAAKTKFALFDRSWGPEHGARDAVGEDHGRDKIDEYLCAEEAEPLTTAAIRALGAADRTLVFLHLAEPDRAGHGEGWRLGADDPYWLAIQTVDRQLGRVLAAVESRSELRGRTAILLTTDHGGGGGHLHRHFDTRYPVNYTIPFLIWIEGGEPQDLYQINRGRLREPHFDNPPLGGLQPLRHLDLAAIACGLL